MVSDPVQDRLKEINAARRKKGGRKPRKVEADAPEQPGNVVNIMDALKRSIAAEQKGKGKGR
jgi:DNA end-binding protein Ku